MEVERNLAESGGHQLPRGTVEPFFITGLPRSRTAWMAAFLSDGDVFCHHDLLNYCLTREAFYDGMRRGPHRTGNSDGGLVITDFQSKFPASRTVVIQRDRDESFASLVELFPPDLPVNRAAFETMADNIDRLKGMKVGFSDLDSAMPDICEYLDLPYNPDRHELFSRLNIQTTDIVLRHDIVSLWR